MILEVLRSGCVGGLVTRVFVGAFGVVLAHYLRERSQARREQVDREQQGRGQPRSDAPGPQEGTQRPWWRRIFGG